MVCIVFSSLPCLLISSIRRFNSDSRFSAVLKHLVQAYEKLGGKAPSIPFLCASTVYPQLAPRLKKSRAIPLLPHFACMTDYRVNLAFTSKLSFFNGKFVDLDHVATHVCKHWVCGPVQSSCPVNYAGAAVGMESACCWQIPWCFGECSPSSWRRWQRNYTYTWLQRRKLHVAHKLHVARKKEALVAVFVTMYDTVYGFSRKFAHCCLSYDRSTASTKESSLRWVRSSASSQFPASSSSSSHHFYPCLYPSMTCFKRQFVRQIWPSS